MFWNIFLETLGSIVIVLAIAYLCYRFLHNEETESQPDQEK